MSHILILLCLNIFQILLRKLSHSSDEIEMLRLSGKSVGEVEATLTEGNINDLLRLQTAEKDIRAVREQKVGVGAVLPDICFFL